MTTELCWRRSQFHDRRDLREHINASRLDRRDTMMAGRRCMPDTMQADRAAPPPAAAETDGFLARIDALLPRIRAEAAATERRGHVSPETIAALAEAGVFRAVQPRQWGGLEL